MRQRDWDKGGKEGNKKERWGWTEEKRGGIIQLLEETDRLKTFRGGICRGDPEILSQIKGISGGFRGVVLTINCKIVAVSLNSYINFLKDIYLYIYGKQLLLWKCSYNIVCKRWLLLANCFVILVKKSLPQEVGFKLHIKMINCSGMNRCWNTLEWCRRGWGLLDCTPNVFMKLQKHH